MVAPHAVILCSRVSEQISFIYIFKISFQETKDTSNLFEPAQI